MTTNPAPANPVPTDPAPANPVPTNPAPANPVPTDPATAKDVPGDSATTPVSAAPVPARRPRRPVPLVSGAVALLLVAGGGVWAFAALGDADRSAPTVLVGTPGAAASRSPGAPVAPGLRGKLLPLPRGYQLGPDIDEFGNEAAFGAQQATARMKEGDRGLPADRREKYDKAVDGLKIQGAAMRSYTDSNFVTEMWLARLENTKAIKNLTDAQTEVMRASGGLRKGPVIEGHANAVCFLEPKDDTTKLDVMLCNAYEGDVMVTAYTYAPVPLDTAAAAGLLRKQLDFIKSPGESE
ncbi:hypothetical protein GCM10010331_63980 [Streptomyces xanthochromogenes]|uniref:hypothetical protein n=1 Tax=Streptomyces xanthochromogenes TaxID=67384 RepID=UPI00167AC27E|nr:hypothetical protein [Streptomyces xanthochromogenes]GHB67273.1 hypothetical protein GCM10010331_63980 [Streptomyces xanthochromogenes]